MKKIFRKIMFGVLFLVIGIFVIGLILAWLPSESLTKHIGISPEKAAEVRQGLAATHQLITTSDGETLFLRTWKPDTAAHAGKDVAVLILHGITAHSGAYDEAGRTIASNGYATFGLDYRGHGLSGGNRADNPGKDRFTDDLAEAVNYIKGLGYPKVVVMGHSMGVASAIVLANAKPDALAGLILLSGAYERRKEGEVVTPSLFQKAKILSASVFRPSFQAVEYYRPGMTVAKDSLYNYRYTLRFVSMIDAKELKIKQDLHIPILVGMGDKDELFTVEKGRELYDIIPGNQKEFLVLKDTYHAKFPVASWQQCADWLNRTFTPNP